MKLAISQIAWSKSKESQVAEILKSHNITALELAPTLIDGPVDKLTNHTISAFLKFWKRWDINPVAMQSLLFGTKGLNIFGPAHIRQKTREHIKRIIDVGSMLGVKVYVFGSPLTRVPDDPKSSATFTVAREFFTNIAAYAYSRKGKICLEPNPIVYGCRFVTTHKEAVNFVESIHHPGLRINIDIGIMALNREDPDVIDSCMPWLSHVHISEPNLSLVGKTSNALHREVADKLKKYHYKGTVSIEMKAPPVKNLGYIIDAISYVKSTYNL